MHEHTQQSLSQEGSKTTIGVARRASAEIGIHQSIKPTNSNSDSYDRLIQPDGACHGRNAGVPMVLENGFRVARQDAARRFIEALNAS